MIEAFFFYLGEDGGSVSGLEEHVEKVRIMVLQ